jgi:hypothetical protein
MKYAMTGIAAAAALAVVALTPAAAEAGWRGGYWGGGWVLASASISARVPIIGITPTGTVPITTTAIHMGTVPAGSIVTGTTTSRVHSHPPA